MGARSTSRLAGLALAGLALAVAAWLAVGGPEDSGRGSSSVGVAPVGADGETRTQAGGPAPADLEPPTASGATAPDSVGDSGVAALAASPDAERRALPVGLRGRVATSDGDGVGSVALVVRFVGSERAQTVSAPDGSFAFAADARIDVGYLCAEKPGWRFAPERLRSRSVEDGAAAEFVGEEIAGMPFRVHVIDVATRESVPYLELSLSRGRSRGIEVVSDATGLVVHEPGFEAGPVEVRTSLRPAKNELDHPPPDGADEHVLRVRVGPTYRLAVEGEGRLDAERFEAVLTRRGLGVMGKLARALESGAVLPGLSWSPAELLGEQRAWVRTDPLLDGLPWVRFDETPAAAGGGAFELVLVGEAAGGRAPVPTVRGIAPDPVVIELGPSGAILGKVVTYQTWHDGMNSDPSRGLGPGSVSSRGGIRLAGLPASVRLESAAGVPVLETLTSGLGAFRFDALAPGEYVVTADGARGGTASTRVTVLAGDEANVELRLPRDPYQVSVGGELHSRSGAYRGRIQLDLVSLTDPTVRFRERSHEAMRTPFVFRGIPPGSYELRVRSSEGFAWTPPTLIVEMARTDVVLTCEDEARTVPVRLDVRDADTNEPIEAEGGVVVGDSLPIDPVSRVAAPSRGRWYAFASGYHAAVGTFEVAPDQDELVIDVRLRRGESLVVFAVTPWGDALPGVEVLVDGAPVGVTDRLGSLVADRVRARRSIDARLAGWVALQDDERLESANLWRACAIVMARE